jgi:hypothetical protein
LNPRGTCAPIRFRVGRLQPGSATPPRNRISMLHVAPTFNLRLGCGRVLVLSRCHPVRRRDEPLDGRAQVIRGRAQVYPRHDEAGDESVRVANPKGRPLERGPSPSGDSPAKVNCELSSRYLPRPSTPVPCISQIPRLCRHQPPPRVHCCASLNIGLGVGAGIFEAHPARSHTIAPISIASRTMVHLLTRLKATELRLRTHSRVARSVRSPIRHRARQAPTASSITKASSAPARTVGTQATCRRRQPSGHCMLAQPVNDITSPPRTRAIDRVMRPPCLLSQSARRTTATRGSSVSDDGRARR